MTYRALILPRRSMGFTLIETLVYLALFSLIIGGFIVVSYMLFEASGRNQTRAMLQQEKNFLVGKIDWILDGAQTIHLPEGSAPDTTLFLTKYGGSSYRISLEGREMAFDGRALSTADVTVSNLVFIRRIESGTGLESIEAGFTITARTPAGAVITETASTTRYLRK